MQTMKKLTILLILFVSYSVFSVSREDKIVYAFRDTGTGNNSKMIVIGETVSIDKASMIDDNTKIDKDLMQIGVDLRPDMLTVKVLHNPGIRVGQTLYLIEKNPDHISYKDGNVVGQIKVVSIFNTSFFGQQLRGEGYLRLIESKVMTVAMPIESESLEDAIVLKKQGDYFVAKGDVANAISFYKRAIKMDKNYPEPHYALGKIHTTSGEGYVSAGYEYKIAWNNRDKFVDQHENLDTCLEVSKEALRMSPYNYDTFYSVSYSYFLYFLKMRDSQPKIDTEEKMAVERVELRKKQEEYLGKAQENMEKALKIRHQDYKIQTLTISLYFEKLRDIPNPETHLTERNDLKSKIEFHGKHYLIYKPKSKKMDKRIRDILEVAKGL